MSNTYNSEMHPRFSLASLRWKSATRPVVSHWLLPLMSRRNSQSSVAIIQCSSYTVNLWMHYTIVRNVCNFDRAMKAL